MASSVLAAGMVLQVKQAHVIFLRDLRAVGTKASYGPKSGST